MGEQPKKYVYILYRKPIKNVRLPLPQQEALKITL